MRESSRSCLGVDSSCLGVDSNLRVGKLILCILEPRCLGVDSTCLGVDSPLRDENTVFCLGVALSLESTRTLWESTRISVSKNCFSEFSLVYHWESTLAFFGVDPTTIGVDSHSSGVDSNLRVENPSLTFLPFTPWSRLVLLSSWLAKHWSRLEFLRSRLEDYSFKFSLNLLLQFESFELETWANNL